MHLVARQSKKILFTFYFLLFTFFLAGRQSLFCQSEVKNFQPIYAQVLKDNVNIRAGEGLDFESLGQLSKDSRVLVLGEEFDWYKIKLPKEALCFVHQDYIDEQVVKADRLRIRAGKGVNFNVLGILKRGERVEILAKEGEWLRIVPPASCAGWVKKEYLQLSEQKFVPETPPPRFIALPNEKKIEAMGVIQDLGKIIHRPGTHKLIQDGRVIYYLKSESVDLNRYIYCQVRVRGELINTESVYPVIAVEQIKINE